MSELSDRLEELAPEHRRALLWFWERRGQEIPWPQPLEPGVFLMTRAKGIYKPKGWRHVLSVRETLGSPYADREPVVRPDGSWTYDYFQEGDGLDRLEQDFTNRAMTACAEDGVPVAVLRQTRDQPVSLYRVLGLAKVQGWSSGYFRLEGYAAGEPAAAGPALAAPSVAAEPETSPPAEARERALQRRRRSPEMKLVGYALSRCGVPGANSSTMLPPPWLGTSVWNEAYDQFFDALADGRDEEALRATLKNVRDAFDAHVNNGRRGWIKPDGQPVRKDSGVQEILDAWGDRPEEELVAAVLAIRDRQATEPASDGEEGARRTEGGKTVYVSWRYERDRTNRADAVRIHGLSCMGCQFSFEAAYGPAGAGYIEVHHAIPIAEHGVRETDPARDLHVLCANCHRIVHRRRGMCLSLDALRILVDNGRQGAGLDPLWRTASGP